MKMNQIELREKDRETERKRDSETEIDKLN